MTDLHRHVCGRSGDAQVCRFTGGRVGPVRVYMFDTIMIS